MMGAPLKAGLLGAGYIAGWHADALARVKGARLVGVCDLSRPAAEGFAAARGLKVFSSLDDMLGEVDVVHVLTPPPAHVDPARRILEAGKHAFVEKPLALTSEEVRALGALAQEKKRALGVNHNFLMLPGYERLRADRARGRIGPIDSFAAYWRFPLAPLRAGPYGLWMLRAPQNVLFEIGPHLFAFLADLFEDFEIGEARLRYPITLPGGIEHFQGWRLTGAAGGTAAAMIDLSLIEGHDQRLIELRGVGASARFDFANDAYVLEKTRMEDIVFAPLAAQLSLAGAALKTGLVNAAKQAASLNALAPYGLGIVRACQSFYKSVEQGGGVDRRLGPELAARALAMIEKAAAKAAPKLSAPLKVIEPAEKTKPTMLVIGGSGFIGRALVDRLIEAGFGVRVFSRGHAPGFERAEVFTGDLKSEADLLEAMRGIDGVFHLARANEKSWRGYLDNDVAVTRRIGECALKAGVRRLVYTGTIDCYDAAQANRPITEETPFDRDLEERNLYARSKAACEAALKSVGGLALVIARPGIVIGKGGPLQHWGVAMWRGATACQLWGDGRNIFPFVSAADCADGLVRAMTVPGIEGRAFNLIGEPLLSARDYLDEVGRANGVAIRARATPLWRYYAVDVVKYWAKRLLARKRGLARPSYRDWKSRAQLSPYRNETAKAALGWAPEKDRARFIETAIVDADLFGLGLRPSAATGGDGAGLARPGDRDMKTTRSAQAAGL
ncbi:MAG: NAD-dependent epimerase/dehydratase family protein [Amphiplicatus sp.]